MRIVLALVVAGCIACTETDPTTFMDAAPDPTAGIDPDCDPIAPEHCGVPFPNDFWLIGGHVAFGKNTLPKIRGGDPIDPKSWADSDGFSAGQAPFTYLPGATATGLVSQDEIERSITTDSPTVLMNAETGELMPHFAEIDMSTFHEDDRALILRPAVRLRDRTRYIVAVRHVVDAGGLAIAPSAAFRALRDRIKTTGPLEQRRQHFEDIFARLEKRGIARADLQVAWDYTTASRENNTRVLVAMRDDALKTVGALGPSYRITNIEANPNPWIRKRITGMMTVPLYLDKPESGGRLVLGQDGLPKQNGTAEYEFLLHIPNSATAQNPALLLQNGHGLLGAKSEGQDGYLAMMCGKYNYVAIAVDWIGLAHDDIDLVTDAVASGDIGKFRAAVDRQHQGFVNALLAMRMLQGRMKDDPNMMDGGKPIIDTTQAYYRGDSQGGIFGATYMSISTDITRGLLGEPGMPYNLLLDRSVDFSGFRFLLKGNFPNGIDVQIVLGLIQMIWDRTEPNGYVPYMRENMLPNTPRHEVLIHDAIGDHQVTTLGAHVIARTIGAKNLAPVNRSIWGIEQSSGPIDGSAIVEFDFGLREQKLNLPTMDGEDPHDKVRELDAAMKQSDVFFRTGKVVPVCDGPCNPE